MKFKKLTPFFFSASLIGSFFQWYNYTAMSLLAPVILGLTLPPNSPITQVVSFIYIFSSPLFARMLGAIGIGNFADTFGRKLTILLTVFVMTASILGLCFVPSFARSGFIAPALLLICTLVYGISSGAEWAALATYITESTPPPQCLYYVSYINVSEYLGMMAAQTVIYLVSSLTSSAFFQTDGWRVVLLIGCLFGILGCFQRRRLNETPVYLEVKKSPLWHHTKFGKTFWQYKKEVLLAFGVASLDGVLLSFFLTHAINFFPSPVEKSSFIYFLSNLIVLISGLFLAPFFGKLAERIGGLKLQLYISLAVLIAAYPLCLLFYSQDPFLIFLGNFLFGIPSIGYLAPMGAVLSLLFPPQWRVSCVAIATSLSFAIFAGFIPLFFRFTLPHAERFIPFDVMLCALISLFSTGYLLSHKKKKDLYLLK